MVQMRQANGGSGQKEGAAKTDVDDRERRLLMLRWKRTHADGGQFCVDSFISSQDDRRIQVKSQGEGQQTKQIKAKHGGGSEAKAVVGSTKPSAQSIKAGVDRWMDG